jgi:hypothetical protein
MSKLRPILQRRNLNERDKNLVFDEPTHKYSILTDPDSKYTSVTTWNHSHFPHFDADDTGGGGGGGGMNGQGTYIFGGNGGSGIIAIAFNI